MSIQSFVQQFFGPEAFVDLNTGLLTKNASKFELAMWNRTGGGTGIIPKVTDQNNTLTATGSLINDALALVTDWNLVGTTPAGSGVQLPAMKPGNDCQVWNLGALNLLVYPPLSTMQIDALGNGTPFTLASGKLRVFECWTTTRIASFGN